MLGRNIKLSIIDRYIIGKYFTTFFFTMLLLTVVAVVFDVSERIEKFLSKDLGFWEVANQYYFNFIPWINSLLFPLYSLVTVIFFTSRMADQTEIIPMFGSGMSFKRFLRPFMIASLTITLIHLGANHLLVPRGNRILREFENKYIKQSNVYTKDRNVHLFVEPGVEAFVVSFSVNDSSGQQFQLRKYDSSKITQILTAKTIKWKAEPDIWTIRDYEIRTMLDTMEKFEIFTGKELDTSLNLLVSDFVITKNLKDMMATPDLSRFIDRELIKGSGITRAYEVEKHRRTADPFTSLILSLIGACIASRKVRGGLGLHLAVGVIMGVVFIFLSKLSITIANSDIFSPLISVWIPNILFSGVAFYTYQRAQK